MNSDGTVMIVKRFGVGSVHVETAAGATTTTGPATSTGVRAVHVEMAGAGCGLTMV